MAKREFETLDKTHIKKNISEPGLGFEAGHLVPITDPNEMADSESSEKSDDRAEFSLGVIDLIDALLYAGKDPRNVAFVAYWMAMKAKRPGAPKSAAELAFWTGVPVRRAQRKCRQLDKLFRGFNRGDVARRL